MLAVAPQAEALAPKTTIATPADAAVVSATSLRLSGTAVADERLQIIRLVIRNRDTGMWLQPDHTWAVEPARVDTWMSDVSNDGLRADWEYAARLDVGDYEFAVDVRDVTLRSTLVGWRRFSVAAPADERGPRNQIRWPFRNQIFEDSSVTLQGAADDDVGIDSITLAIRDKSNDQWLQPDGSFGDGLVDVDLTLTAPESPTTAWEFPVDLPRAGDYVAEVTATDVDGNTQRRTIPFEHRPTTGEGGAHYATLIMSRAQWVDAPDCMPTPGAKTLFDVASELRSRGHSATMTVVQERPDESERTCHKNFQINASWNDLEQLRSEYGWHAVAHHKDASLQELDYAEQLDATCGDLAVLLDRGFDRAWGMFAYNGNKSTPEIQTDPTSTCFAWGRRYGSGVNLLNDAKSPWYIRVASINGGYCNDPAAACFDPTFTTAKFRYQMPDELVERIEHEPDRYVLIQHYRFLVGSNVSGPGQRYDCSSPDPRLHWTSETEVYCWNDYLTMLDAIAPDTIVTDPATVAEAWGRLNPN